MQLHDLGPGYHLVPASDHLRVRKPVEPTERDWDLASFVMIDAEREGLSRKEAVAKAVAYAYKRAWDRRKARKPNPRKAMWAARCIDPMAVQLCRILRDVRRELAEG